MGCVLCTDAADPDFHELWNEFRGIFVCSVLKIKCTLCQGHLKYARLFPSDNKVLVLLPGFREEASFDASTLVLFRKRISAEMLMEVNECLLAHNLTIIRLYEQCLNLKNKRD